MRILMLAGDLPESAEIAPTSAGTSMPVLHHLASSHQVSLVLAAGSTRATAGLPQLRDWCRHVELIPARTRPWDSAVSPVAGTTYGRGGTPSRSSAGSIRAAVDRLVREDHIEAIHLDRLGMSQFVPTSWRRPIVLDERRSLWRAFAGRVNETQDPLRRWLLKRETERLRTLEAEACRRATVTIAESEMERAALEQIVGTPWRIHIVPEMVDLRAFEPLWQRRAPEPGWVLTLADGEDDTATRHALSRFIVSTFAKVRHTDPLVRLDVLTQMPVLEGVSTLPGISVASPSSEEARISWKRAMAYLAPPLATYQARRGILSALAAGVPVIAHPAACEGLAVLEGEHLLMAQTPEEFAACLQWLTREGGHMRKLVMRGRQLIREHFDTPVALAGLDAAYEHVSHELAHDHWITGGLRCVYCL
jgi:polysaccharide biosynthesis protein PslH